MVIVTSNIEAPLLGAGSGRAINIMSGIMLTVKSDSDIM